MKETEKKKLLGQINTIVNKIGELDKQRQNLMTELQDIFPIKKDEKVAIVNKDTDEHIRFAYMTDFKVKLFGGKGKEAPGIQFVLYKCKKDGSMSQHSDSLGFNEIIKKI